MRKNIKNIVIVLLAILLILSLADTISVAKKKQKIEEIFIKKTDYRKMVSFLLQDGNNVYCIDEKHTCGKNYSFLTKKHFFVFWVMFSPDSASSVKIDDGESIKEIFVEGYYEKSRAQDQLFVFHITKDKIFCKDENHPGFKELAEEINSFLHHIHLTNKKYYKY